MIRALDACICGGGFMVSVSMGRVCDGSFRLGCDGNPGLGAARCGCSLFLLWLLFVLSAITFVVVFSSLSSFTAPTGSCYFGHMSGGYFPSAVVWEENPHMHTYIHPSAHTLTSPTLSLSSCIIFLFPLPSYTSPRHRSYICGFWNVLFLLCVAFALPIAVQLVLWCSEDVTRMS